MDSTAPKMETEAVTRTRTTEASAELASDAEEMPLLFMDGLPSNFQQSAQLAALATFMADSDDDDERSDGGGEQQAAGKQQSTARLRHAKRRSRTPYARPAPSNNKGDAAGGDSRRKGKKKKKGSDATKELQLYLSMFKV